MQFYKVTNMWEVLFVNWMLPAVVKQVSDEDLSMYLLGRNWGWEARNVFFLIVRKHFILVPFHTEATNPQKDMGV